MQGFIAKDSFEGTGNVTITLSNVMNALVISNAGSAKLTVSTGNYTYIVGPGDIFDEELDPFSTLTITAAGSYYGFVRRHKDEFRSTTH